MLIYSTNIVSLLQPSINIIWLLQKTKVSACWFQRKTYRLSFLSLHGSREEDNRKQNTYTTVASYKGGLVAVKWLQKKHVEITRDVKKELTLMQELEHDNINRFIGACIDPPNTCVVTHYCARGSLKVSFRWMGLMVL